MKRQALRLGPAAIARLLPQQAPLLLVDGVEAYTDLPKHTLWARRAISVHEPVFAGHFPGRPIWPGAYTIEGLGQACALLGAIATIAASGPELAVAFAPLRALDLRARGLPVPAHSPPAADLPVMRAWLAAVDVKLTRLVLPGDRLDYEVSMLADLGDMTRFAVEASVEGHSVAKGTLTAARERVA